MVRMLDREGKGYVTREEFAQFYDESFLVD